MAKTKTTLRKLTPEMIDLLFPEHGRTSCSDEHKDNAFTIKKPDGRVEGPRCNRCFMLVHKGALDPRFQIEVLLTISDGYFAALTATQRELDAFKEKHADELLVI